MSNGIRSKSIVESVWRPKCNKRRSVMTPIDIVKPWRLILGIPPLLYGGLLLLGLPQSTTWLLLVAGVLLVAVVVASRLEYPLLPLWPAFVGLFLLSTFICALIEDVVDYAIVP